MPSAAWYEDPRFDDAERAALALTEAATRLCDRPGAVTDEIWAEAARHYDDRQLGALVLMVAITNFFNRLNTTFRVPAPALWTALATPVSCSTWAAARSAAELSRSS